MSVRELEAGALVRSPRLHAGLVRLSRTLATAGVLAMFGSVCIEVAGRSLIGQATIWVTEVTAYLVVAITFLGAGFVAAEDAHVRVDLVAAKLPAGTAGRLRAATLWLALFLSVVVLWKATAFCAENFESGARSWSLLNAPLWIPQAAVGLGLLALVAILWGECRRAAGPQPVREMLGFLSAATAAGAVIVDGSGIFPVPLSPQAGLAAIAGLVALSALLVSGPAGLAAFAALALPVVLAFAATGNAALPFKAVALVAALFWLLSSGLPVAFALFGIGIAAMAIWLPPVSLSYVGERAWGAVSSFELAAIPMFVLMGALLVRSNASTDMFAAARIGLGRIRGGLAHASILASGLFAAVSGSSLATAATMGRVAGPEMIRAGYRPTLAFGVLAAGGTLGILIPPSVAMIVYGPLAGVPVTHLFMAGVVPGLLMMAAFAAVVGLWLLFAPAAAPTVASASPKERVGALRGVLPFLALMALVLGSLYLGIATPTEAAAVGVLGAVAIGAARRTLTLRAFWAAAEEAAMTTSLLLFIAVGAAVMGFGLDFLSMPQALVRFVQSLQLADLGLFAAIVVLYLVMGTFVESISMVLMTLPIVLPVIAAAGWDPLWFGIVLVMLVEIGLITPPVGMILYVLSGVAGQRVSFAEISLGSVPFVLAFIAMLFVFFAVPGLVTFLPALVR